MKKDITKLQTSFSFFKKSKVERQAKPVKSNHKEKFTTEELTKILGREEDGRDNG